MGEPGYFLPGATVPVGRVRIYSGATFTPLLDLVHGVDNDRFGTSIARLSDVDGDGYDDLLIGAPGSFLNPLYEGSAYVFSAKTGAHLRTLHGALPGDLFGESVAAAPDLDGDGKLDFAVCAPSADGAAGLDVGRVVIVGSKVLATILAVEGVQAGRS